MTCQGPNSSGAGTTHHHYYPNSDNGGSMQSSGAQAHSDHYGSGGDIGFGAPSTASYSQPYQQSPVDTSSASPVAKLLDFLDSMGLNTAPLRSLMGALGGAQPEGAEQPAHSNEQPSAMAQTTEGPAGAQPEVADQPAHSTEQPSTMEQTAVADGALNGSVAEHTAAMPPASYMPGDPASKAASSQHSMALLNDPKIKQNFPEGFTYDQLKSVANSPEGEYGTGAKAAAKWFTDNQLAFESLESAHQGNQKVLDGFVGRQDLGTAAGLTPTREHVLALSQDTHVMTKYQDNITPDTLKEIMNDSRASDASKKAAAYLLDNPQEFTNIDIAAQTNDLTNTDPTTIKSDSLIHNGDLKAYVHQGNVGVSEGVGGTERRLTPPSAPAVEQAVEQAADAVPVEEEAPVKTSPNLNTGHSKDDPEEVEEKEHPKSHSQRYQYD